MLSPKKFWFQKNYRSKKFWVQKNDGPKKLLDQKKIFVQFFLGQYNFDVKNILCPKNFWLLEFFLWILKLSQLLQGQVLLGKMSLPTNTGSPTNQPSKFGWVLTSNIRDRDMVSYCHYSETWTNVTGTNVVWSNVPEIVASKYR